MFINILLPPSLVTSALILSVAPRTRVINAIIEATPITMPSIVKKERSLFFIMFIHDILMLSRNKWFQLLFRYYSVKYMDDPSCTDRYIAIVCYHHYCYAVTI